MFVRDPSGKTAVVSDLQGLVNLNDQTATFTTANFTNVFKISEVLNTNITAPNIRYFPTNNQHEYVNGVDIVDPVSGSYFFRKLWT